MEDRVRARVDPLEWRMLAGVAGERYSAEELAQMLGVSRQLVVRWIDRGWLRASKLRGYRGYRIRRRAVRRLFADHPAAVRAWAKAMQRAKDTQNVDDGQHKGPE